MARVSMIIMCRQAVSSCFLGMMTAYVAMISASGAAREGATKENAGDELFTHSAIPHLRIEIAESDMATLRLPVPRSRKEGERPSVPATVREGDSVWTNVAIHLKGSFGSFRPVMDKPALTLNFD